MTRVSLSEPPVLFGVPRELMGAAAPTAARRLKPIRLLLVEDDEIDQQAFKRFVAREGLPYECTVTASLRGAQRALATAGFDVVVSDYLLGDGTAFDVLRAAGGMPFILITGGGDEQVAVAALRAGVSDYLVKDVRRGDLLRLPLAVDRAVRMAKAEQLLRVFSRALDCLPDCMAITDAAGRLLFASQEFRRLHDVTGEPPCLPESDEEGSLPPPFARLTRRAVLDDAGAIEAVVYLRPSVEGTE